MKILSVSQTLPTSSPIVPVTVTSLSDSPIDSWDRHAYYDAASGHAHGFTFLNHYGGTEGMPGTSDGGSSLVLGYVKSTYTDVIVLAHLSLMLLLTENRLPPLRKCLRTLFLTMTSKLSSCLTKAATMGVVGIRVRVALRTVSPSRSRFLFMYG